MRPTPRPRFRNPAPAPVSRHPVLRQSDAAGFGGSPAPSFKASPVPARSPLIAKNVTGAIGSPGSGSLPPDPAYEQQAGGIIRGRDQTIAGLKGERDRTLLDYGYNVQYDAAGNPLLDTLSFDPTNVFSRAAQLRKRWMEARSGTKNGMAAQGQLGSGAYGRAQRQNNYGESAQTDAEIKGLTEFLARNGSQIAQARIAGEGARITAEGDRITRAPTLPGYVPSGPPMAPGGAGIANYNDRPYATKVGTDSKGRRGEWHFWPGKKPVFVPYK